MKGMVKSMLSLYLSMLESIEEQSRFESIYLEYRNSMYAVAVSILRNRQDAEDAVHNVFLSIAENFLIFSQKATTETDIKNYLLIAVKNRAIDQLRKRTQQRNLKEKLEEKTNLPEPIGFEKAIEAADDYNAIVSAIQTLQNRYKQVLYLNLVMEFDIGEISKLTNTKKEKVASYPQPNSCG